MLLLFADALMLESSVVLCPLPGLALGDLALLLPLEPLPRPRPLPLPPRPRPGEGLDAMLLFVGEVKSERGRIGGGG